MSTKARKLVTEIIFGTVASNLAKMMPDRTTKSLVKMLSENACDIWQNVSSSSSRQNQTLKFGMVKNMVRKQYVFQTNKIWTPGYHLGYFEKYIYTFKNGSHIWRNPFGAVWSDGTYPPFNSRHVTWRYFKYSHSITFLTVQYCMAVVIP